MGPLSSSHWPLEDYRKQKGCCHRNPCWNPGHLALPSRTFPVALLLPPAPCKWAGLQVVSQRDSCTRCGTRPQWPRNCCREVKRGWHLLAQSSLQLQQMVLPIAVLAQLHAAITYCMMCKRGFSTYRLPGQPIVQVVHCADADAAIVHSPNFHVARSPSKHF
jgi:hypothetical protein